MFSWEQRRQKAVLAISDGLAVFAAFQIALALRDPTGRITAHLESAGTPLLYTSTTLLVLMWLVVFHAFDLYRFRNGGSAELVGIIKACTSAVAMTVLLEFLAHVFVSRVVMTTGFVLSIAFV